MDVKVTKSVNEKLVEEIILTGLTKVVNEGEFYFEDGKFKLSQEAQSYMDTVCLHIRALSDRINQLDLRNEKES